VEILKLLKSHRSIRIYQDKPIPQDLLLQILESGRWAATGANLQPWHFIVVTDPDKRKKIGEVARFFFTKKTIALTGAGISVGLVAPQVKSFLQLLKK
jgi:nitroreductase